MTAAIGLSLLIWGIVIFIIGMIFLVIGGLYRKKGKEYHDMQKLLLQESELRVKYQYNKIACLSPKELTDYIGNIFSRYLELVGEQETKNDPEVIQRMYANALARTLEHIGDETVLAIEYYYGSQFIEKWSELAMLLLEKRRKLGQIMDDEIQYPDILSYLAQAMPTMNKEKI